MYYIKTDRDVRIAVYDLNPQGKKTVFLIHGWPVNHNMFEYQLNVLPQLGYRCVSIDLRGFGSSDAPWDGYDYDRMADDVYEVIRSLNVTQMTLLGFSVGGAISIRYMARYRGFRVSKLILVSAAAPSFTQRPNFPYGMTRQAVNAMIAQTARNRPQMLEEFGRNFFATRVTDSFSRWFSSLSYVAPGYSTIHLLESLRDEDLRQDLPKVHAPTSIFYGALDKICPYPLPVEISKGIPGSQLFRFDQSGHGVFYDELESFNSRLIAVLNG